ncbi:MAG TPA: asparagine synthase (glutamine-hydrolyzing) [Candidatus Dormibacteraeota bacterium]|nr:asparagine synthase (glutamine-hydrolyzing) [Candidatus Dormibacteraeota bacterium]
MCGIAGAIDVAGRPIPHLGRRLDVMNDLQAHRGPDGHATWKHDHEHVGFAHRRLAIIDLNTGDQPITDGHGSWISYNGEIYNYIELRAELGGAFRTTSDTEVALRAYQKWGTDCLQKFRGMFAFSLWDAATDTLFCARDRFGIKPFYYAEVDGVLYFASEIKALIPFLPSVETDVEGLKDYLCFQFCLGGKTLFKGVKELPPGHMLTVRDGKMTVSRYWEVYYQPDFDHTATYFESAVHDLVSESVALHLRSDVPVGAYLSGGLDSSIVASIAAETEGASFLSFTGRFGSDPAYDESDYARELAEWKGFQVLDIDIGADDFVRSMEKVIYHLDMPVAGPGSFPQYLVSQLAAKHRKVVLGGQGGDEIFGGYTRYLVAYFEQCIKGAIEGTTRSGRFVVTYESIIPNLVALKNYKPMLQEFWREGLFDDLDRRYFRLINRAPTLGDEINWAALGQYDPFETFRGIFHGANVDHESYFDSMTHFDFKTLLPALLQVEDRVSMAHGLESRVPFLDHRIVELAATIPADIKFENGNMKHVLRTSMRSKLPNRIFNRQDKMGFPVPLHEWITDPGPVRDWVRDVFSSQPARSRELIDNSRVLKRMDGEARFGRQVWGLLSLELWQRAFHDRAHEYRRLLHKPVEEVTL